METYDSRKAEEAQKEFCREKGIPIFAPSVCFRCHNDIYGKGGYSVEYAGKYHICYCPFCSTSFDD